MLNNKGFAVSSILYTLLIAFLLFLGAALAQLSASSSLIGKANDDLINGVTLSIDEVVTNNNLNVRIKSRYGIKYWPKDFLPDIENSWMNGNLIVTCTDTDDGSLFSVSDKLLMDSKKSIDLSDKCSTYK